MTDEDKVESFLARFDGQVSCEPRTFRKLFRGAANAYARFRVKKETVVEHWEKGTKVKVIGPSVTGIERLEPGTESTVLFGNHKIGYGIEGFLHPVKSLRIK